MNITKDCRRQFADGYDHSECNNEENLFDGFDNIRGKLKDCSPFFNTICTQEISNGICDPQCNNSECIWDGLDCINTTLETFGKYMKRYGIPFIIPS